MNRRNLIFLLLVLFVSMGFFSLVFSAKPSDTPSWKSYIDVKYKFSLKYPAFIKKFIPPSELFEDLIEGDNEWLSLKINKRPLDGMVYKYKSGGGSHWEYKYDENFNKWKGKYYEISVYPNRVNETANPKEDRSPRQYRTAHGYFAYVTPTGGDGGDAIQLAYIEAPSKTWVLELTFGTYWEGLDPAARPKSDDKTILKILDTVEFTKP